MRTLYNIRLMPLLLISIFLLTWSCRREVEVPLPARPQIVGKPSVASLGGLVTGAVGGDKIEFRVDMYVVDRSGKYVQGLNQSNFGITATSPASFTYSLAKLEVVNQAAKTGGYSAMLLLDQSGSILSTDPKDLRISASKIFLDYLGTSDQAGLASFTDDYFGAVKVHQTFSRNTAAMKKSLDTLATTEDGGTPLYYSSVLMTDYTATNAKTANKAVIIFTDGENTNSSATLANAIDRAKNQGVPLYMVGLSNGVNVSVLSRMANETGGAFFYAKDAEQLVTSFGTLGNLLRGSAQLYRSTWTAARRTGKWTSGQIISETIKVALPNGDIIDVPFYLQIP
ncbi:vWA domain-containing protein [Fibrella arboris]|uniref:vWA domain-containing protein n=1 Tax=Fibrella arboris TaxID=3242486 RepID=UPI0035207996